jgi:hypothetical protein
VALFVQRLYFTFSLETCMRTTLTVAFAAVLGFGALGAFAADEAKLKTIAALHKEKSTLSGKDVRVQGKVVKVNNGIMGRNFLHVQDGTGDQSSNDLTVTSKETASARATNPMRQALSIPAD